MSLVHQVDFNPANQSAFGTLETNELTASFQGDFVNGLNTQMWQTPVTSGTGATVDTNSGRLRIQSGTASNGYAYIITKRPVRYRAGQGTTARFTPLFTAGVANNIQVWGMGAPSANAPYDGYYFGYNGTSFGIVHYNRGTPTWYSRDVDWNGDKVNGTTGTSFNWNPVNGSPVMIKYPYLGYGDINFFVQHPETAAWVRVHTIQYANTSTTTQLSNPTMYFMGYTANSGNTTNQTMYCGSVGVFVSGMRSFVGNPKWAADSYKTGISTTETSLLQLKNATTYNGVTNRSLIRLSSISISSTANTSTFIRLKINPTVGGSPSFTPVNGSTADGGTTITSGNSITSFDVAGTSITAASGLYIWNMSLGPSSVAFIDLVPMELYISPGDIGTFSGQAQANTNLGLSVNWTEDI